MEPKEDIVWFWKFIAQVWKQVAQSDFWKQVADSKIGQDFKGVVQDAKTLKQVIAPEMPAVQRIVDAQVQYSKDNAPAKMMKWLTTLEENKIVEHINNKYRDYSAEDKGFLAEQMYKRLLQVKEEAKSRPQQQPESQTAEQKPFFERIWEDLKKRWQDIARTWWETKKAVSENEWLYKELVKPWVTLAWDIAWWLWDVAGELIVSAYRVAGSPWAKKVEEFLSTDAWKQVTEVIQAWWNAYSEWANNNPETARFLESVTNIASNIPVFKWAQLWAKWVERAAETSVWKAIKSWVWTAVEAVSPTRASEEISANILQPMKSLTENLPDANKWLKTVIQDTWVKWTDFKELVDATETTINKYWKELWERLKQADNIWPIKDESVSNALVQLDNVYSDVKSKDLWKTKTRIQQLIEKNDTEWLTPSEINEVKILHTKANSIFNEKWQATWWFNKDDLRALRKDLKLLVEQQASKAWVDVKEVNTKLSELYDAKTLLDNQVMNLKSFSWRQIPKWILQKITEWLLKIPLVWTSITDLIRWVATAWWLSLRSDKINVIQIQEMLPKLIKELKKAWVKEWDISVVKQSIKEAAEEQWIPFVWKYLDEIGQKVVKTIKPDNE